MASMVVLPKIGLTMTEGTLAQWLVADGAPVEKGEPIFQMCTEKVNTEVEAEEAGILRHLVAEDATVAAGAVVGCLLAEGEELPAEFDAMAASVAEARAAAAARAAEPAAPAPAAAGPRPGPQSPAGVRPASTSAEAEFRPVSPLARRLADELGVDLSQVVGRGPGGRIVKEDVERAAAEEAPVAATAGEVVPFKGMRRTIAQRMHESLQTMAQLTIATEVDMTEAVKLRGQLVDDWQTEALRPTYTDLVLKAAALALSEHPRVNATLEGESIRLLSDVNVGLAVSLEEGLIVPVVKDADKKSLKQIAAETADLSERARVDALSVEEVMGAGFTVTSLGMYGVDTFTPIVNPPQAAILGVGRIREVPRFVARDEPAQTGARPAASGGQGDQVLRRSVMDLSLSFDHRLLDGAPAAQFLGRVRELLERPQLLIDQD